MVGLDVADEAEKSPWEGPIDPSRPVWVLLPPRRGAGTLGLAYMTHVCRRLVRSESSAASLEESDSVRMEHGV